MTYRELYDFVKKHPNPFWNKEQHEQDFELRYNSWLAKQYYSAAAEKGNRTR